MVTPLTVGDMHFYRHPEILTGRPFAFDVDEKGVIWEGSAGDLYWHDPATARSGKLRTNTLGQLQAISVFCFGGKLIVLHGEKPFYTFLDPLTGESASVPLPGQKPIIWYGLKTGGPGGTGGGADKLLLFDRSSAGGILLADRPEGPLRKVTNPFGSYELSGGRLLDDGRVLITKHDDLKLLFFDPVGERFTEQIDSPYKDVSVSGGFAHRGVLYLADSAAGRLLAFHLSERKWLPPIPTPDYQKVYGFIGGGFSHQGVGYFCLSSYRFQSRLDPATGKLIIPEGAEIGCDGKPHHFLDRFLVFNADAREFSYLRAPEQPDGYPLICYSRVVNGQVFISGYVMPWLQPGSPSKQAGDWIIWQSFPARVEPFRADAPVTFDKDAHIRRSKRRYGPERGLYVEHMPWVPPVKNMEGPSLEFPPGVQQELDRRLAVTDRAAYWKTLAGALSASCGSDAEKAAAVGAFVQSNSYYNPIAISAGDPLLMFESRDVRCGQSVQIALAILEAMGAKARKRGLANHVVAEVHYDGDWHLLDSIIFGGNQPTRNGRVPSLDEVIADPLFIDAWPLACFDYDTDELRTRDGFYLLGYVFGEWGTMPFYSGYMGEMKGWEFPPTLPLVLPAQRLGARTVRLRWAEAIRRGGGKVDYVVRVYDDRAMKRLVHEATVAEPHLDFDVPETNFMYHFKVSAVCEHRQKNLETWYPHRVGNFALVPPEQYGWYGIV